MLPHVEKAYVLKLRQKAVVFNGVAANTIHLLRYITIIVMIGTGYASDLKISLKHQVFVKRILAALAGDKSGK